jgi:hypothetical protein
MPYSVIKLLHAAGIWGTAILATLFTELLDSQQQQGSALQVEQTQQLHWKLR